MEILGTYKVKELSGQHVIHAPIGTSGKYLLTMNDDGSFLYKPVDGQIASPKNTKYKGTRFLIIDSVDETSIVSFFNEKEAFDYKMKMEKQCGRIFRMQKVFDASKIKTLVEG